MDRVAAVAIIDTRGWVTGWSEGARLLTGHPAEAVVGRPATELLAAELPAAALAARTGTRHGTVALRHRDGHRLDLAVTACPLEGGDGRPAGYAVTAEPPGVTFAAQAFEQASMSMSVFDLQQRYLRLNAAACKVIGVPEEGLTGRFFLDTVADTESNRGFVRHLREVAETGLPVRYESFAAAPALNREHFWSLEMWPLRDASGTQTAVALAAYDSNEQYWARRRLALLNEAAAHIGTTLDVVRTAEELIEILVPRYADFATVDLLDWVLGADEPPMVAADDVELHRVAYKSTRPGSPGVAVRVGETQIYRPPAPPACALREGHAILSQAGEPGFRAWLADRNERAPQGAPFREGVHSMIAVPLRARGTTLGVAVCVRLAHPEDYGPDDAVFAEELASRAAVCIDNARRFARERTTALALQHSLLPSGLPGQAALDVAHRYLPSGSQAGIGGDWFDVIPLSGGRVGLVVGDVVGHGISSSATMGRLRTAVRTLADVDLPPDELLTHLDDLVTHLAAENGREEVAEIGATCVYAVYDPVSRRLALATAGHPAPFLVLPDGDGAELVPLTAGPPLGIGGLPFEATELELPEGSVVALFTDGLVAHRAGNPDGADDELRRALGASADSLDALADGILKAVLPDQPGDDVALLLVRTRALGADRVATWDVPAHPAQVAVVRQAAGEQLAAWGLEETAFVTELVVSELVTNAIRYGEPPIQLRLIRDRALICEVSDASSTSPHLRRAHAYDEGGRGLLLVAQLTQRWGSRQTAAGKTIWAEQPLPDA
ncbi:SpoIIE family protein phosphatase [Streptomyces sp. SID4946]|uniref:ATP-binding SpoIIE family protein phosphatase n=1 Tax=Streptomyces TaxID=1883 RepID=UPI00081D4E80|nr:MULTISPECIES: SpoIIE family protein phosphatase [unclassified Streptomyces]MYQ91080.1 SpoIIE family protein phosphatase [Streptomyces sp. SID4946]SCF64999.1 PAS domain S-box-containing protein [Streptomyces sp. DconLS]SCF68097.1 PAS domain S-box-containing protein [Streptomyces sp. LamerLS-31b]